MANDNIEIERKYLLKELPKLVFDLAHKSLYIKQAWLPGDNLKVRIRESIVSDGEHNYFWGIKLGQGVSRTEIENCISPELFKDLWPHTDRRIFKYRYHVNAENNLFWEVDQFLDRDLALAEIEMPTADYNVIIPDWLAPYIVREVTDEKEYNNIALAKQY